MLRMEFRNLLAPQRPIHNALVMLDFIALIMGKPALPAHRALQMRKLLYRVRHQLIPNVNATLATLPLRQGKLAGLAQSAHLQ